VIGATVSSANGAGVYGDISQPPNTGGFKYSVLGNDRGLDFSYALALFGSGFYTGNLMQMSDQRLKTDIHNADYGLADVMKLRPTYFHYDVHSPYHFDEGEHAGFIAQEVEEVLPQLVKDIVLPIDPSQEKISTSETVTYKGVNYIELIPILTSAIQELNQKLETQAAE